MKYVWEKQDIIAGKRSVIMGITEDTHEMKAIINKFIVIKTGGHLSNSQTYAILSTMSWTLLKIGTQEECATSLNAMGAIPILSGEPKDED